MSKLYSIDVQICGTAYVRASSKLAALAKLGRLTYDHLEFKGSHVSDLPYDHADLPAVSLSPAMTLHGIWPGAKPERSN